MTTQEELALTQALRLPAMREPMSVAQVVGRWMERAHEVLTRLDVLGPAPLDAIRGRGLAAEALVTWQALARLANDAPYATQRGALRERLATHVTRRADELGKLAQRAFVLKELRQELEAHADVVGAATEWDEEERLRAVSLVERLDDALLCEAAVMALEVDMEPSFARGVQACSEAVWALADSLMPAHAFIQASAVALDPGMRAASTSYTLWLVLMDAYSAWGVQEGLIQLATKALREALDLSTR
jgi:hypothetical protein